MPLEDQIWPSTDLTAVRPSQASFGLGAAKFFHGQPDLATPALDIKKEIYLFFKYLAALQWLG